jgi:hypothetical protein
MFAEIVLPSDPELVASYSSGSHELLAGLDTLDSEHGFAVYRFRHPESGEVTFFAQLSPLQQHSSAIQDRHTHLDRRDVLVIGDVLARDWLRHFMRFRAQHKGEGVTRFLQGSRAPARDNNLRPLPSPLNCAQGRNTRFAFSS